MNQRVTLISKPDCHLCDQARETVNRVCTDLNIEWTEYSIFDDPQLADQYAEFVPVILVDGKPHDQFGVSETRLRTALAA